ncbi:MAG: hypothetical protein QM765_03195 [Myxococcales bacterium]
MKSASAAKVLPTGLALAVALGVAANGCATSPQHVIGCDLGVGARVRRGEAALAEGDLDKAEQSFAIGLEFDPDDASAHLGLQGGPATWGPSGRRSREPADAQAGADDPGHLPPGVGSCVGHIALSLDGVVGLLFGKAGDMEYAPRYTDSGFRW